MQQFYLTWATEYATGDTEIDKNYQKILDAGLVLYSYINYGNLPQDKVLELALKTCGIILTQMEMEISVLKTYLPQDVEAHERDHIKYKLRFDLEQKYSVSNKMRIIMSAKMVKEYMGEHFFGFDVQDLQKIKDKFQNLQNDYKAS